MGSAKELNGAGGKAASSVHKRKNEDDGYRHDDRRKKVKVVDGKGDRQERPEKGRGERERGSDRDRPKDVVEKEREKPRDKSERDRERDRFERDHRDRDRDKREKERSSREKDRDNEKGKERSSRDKTRDTERERDKGKERSHGNGVHSRIRDHDRHSDKERDRESARNSEMDPRAGDREEQQRGNASDKDRDFMEKEVLERDAAKPDLEGCPQTSSIFQTIMQGSEVAEPVDLLPQGNSRMNSIEDANLNEDGNATQNAKGSSLSAPSAVAKAKRALEMQKLLSEKIKKLPQVNRTMTQMSTGSFSVSLSMTSSSELSSTVSSISAGPTVDQLPQGSGVSLTASTPMNANSLNTGFNFLPNMMPNFSRLIPGVAPVANYETLIRVQEVAARLGIQQGPDSLPFLAMQPGQVSDSFGTAGQQKGVKGPVLRLDAQGREIDEHGNILEMTKVSDLSTLKVNINKQKKDSFQILHPELEDDPVSNPFFDPSMGIDKKKLLRPKRPSFQFVEEGRWSKQAEMIRLKSQFGEAQAKEIKTKQAVLAKARAEADINPNLIEVSERFPVKEEKPKDSIPEIEWWDAVLLPSGSYSDDGELKVKMEKLTIYVEHPIPIEPPAEPAPPPPQPLKLTKKEQKKLRTQRRLAKEKDRQEMIRQGLLEPPKPKVKMSNLMKVLGAEATQDPTKLEMEIRTAAAEREQAHTDRNLARKLTPAERREKKERKLFDDPNTLETLVSVYRINNISNPQIRFKVDINAQENRLTGCLVMCDTMNVVVVEGGSKAIKRYSKLMLQRIKWATAVKEDEEAENEGSQQVNKCALVWQGSVAKPSFEKFLIQQCRTEAAARKFLADSGVGHYWDLAANFIEE